jgi:hypothetical protein
MNPASLRLRARVGFVLGCALAGFAGSGATAYAQAWLPDRNYTEGPGIRVGDVELHPGVVVRGGYDTNVFRADEETQDREGSAVLAVTPHLNISTLGVQRRTQGEDQSVQPSFPTLSFRGGASLTYFHYFVEGGPKNLEIDTDFALTIFPQRPVSVDVGIGYLRNVRPFAQRRLAADVTGDYIFNVISPSLRVNFGSRSRVLTGYVGYAPRIQLYESAVYDYLDYFQHGVQAGAAWRFLPSTALVYDAQVDVQDYKESFEVTNSPVLFAENTRFRTRLGLNGALTRKLEFRALAGYAAGFFDNDELDDFEAAVAEASLTYRFGPTQANRVFLSYQRDVQSSAMGGWVRFDRGSLGLTALLGQVFLLSLEGGATHITYGRLVGRRAPTTAESTAARDLVALGDGNEFDRSDVRLDGAVRGEYRATNWLAFTGDFSAQVVLTDFDYAVAVQGAGALPDPADYTAFSVFGGVRFHY